MPPVFDPEKKFIPRKGSERFGRVRKGSETTTKYANHTKTLAQRINTIGIGDGGKKIENCGKRLKSADWRRESAEKCRGQRPEVAFPLLPQHLRKTDV